MEILETTRKHPLAKCEVCPLVRKRCAPSYGPIDAKVAIVSRSPGKADVIRKRPFAGESGKVLDHLLEMYDYGRDEVFTTNIVLCEYDGAPPKEAIEACSERLHSEIQNADTVIAAGAEAVSTLTRRKSLSGSRGYEHKRYSNGRTQRIIATNNPALVLRDDSAFPDLIRDFRLALRPLPKPTLPTVRWTNNPEEAWRWLDGIKQQKIELLSTDIETKGLRASAPIVAIGFSASGDKAISLGYGVCNHKDFYKRIDEVLSKNKGLYHNGKFDTRNLKNKGLDAKVAEDTMLLSFALDERSDEEQVHKLEYLLMNELNWPNYEPKEVVQYKATVRRLEKELKIDELDALPVPNELYKYNALDAAGTAQLFPILKQRAIDEGVFDRPYRSILIPLSEALTKIELEGMPFDYERALDMLEEEVWPNLNQLRAELQLIVGRGNYNPNSPQQNAEIVYDIWKIIHNLPTKPGKERSVDKAVYTEIKAGRFVIGGSELETKKDRKETAVRWAEKFADFKALDKQRSTYLEGMIPRAIYNGGRIYTDFKEHNAVTARLTSSKPNLQNITRTKPGLPNIRSLFIAEDGYSLVNGDYSQAELRAIAALSGDANLSGIYKKQLDLHDIAAERFYGANFTKEQRSKAKNMNFGVAFEQTAATFQEKHNIPEDEGQAFIDWWWSEFPQVKEWEDEVKRQVQRDGYVQSPFGHKRRFHLITRQNRNAIFREAINFFPQSTAAQFTNYSLIKLINDDSPCPIEWSRATINLTVHDSITGRCTRDNVHYLVTKLHSTLVSAPKESIGWDFPFEVDMQIGDDWGNLHDYET